MSEEVLKYIKTQKVGVLAVALLDGSLHGATVHFAHREKSLEFYIETGIECRKSEPLLKNESTPATFVIGSDPNNMQTLQMDGIARVARVVEEDSFIETYLAKFPNKEGKVKDPDAVFIIFTPSWWRFTDWTTPEGKKIWSSE